MVFIFLAYFTLYNGLQFSILFSVVAAPSYIPTNPVHEDSSHPGQHSLLLCLRIAILTNVR